MRAHENGGLGMSEEKEPYNASEPPKQNKEPSDQVIMIAYQVTARIFATESQLIWTRTAFFIGLNSLVAAALNYVDTIPDILDLLIPFVGSIYAICWLFSMERMWQYHTYYIRLMREQEKALGLDKLGPNTRGQKIAEGEPELVDGEETKFIRASRFVRAKYFVNTTTLLFVVVYLVFLYRYLSRWLF